jgi:hypothetical protein
MPISITKPAFSKTKSRLQKLEKFDARSILEEYGRRGVIALSNATPVDDGSTSRAWTYKVVGNKNRYRIIWSNSEMAGTAPLVLLLQYGHGTRGGTFVSGRDFINPALRPIFDDLAKRLWREVLG